MPNSTRGRTISPISHTAKATAPLDAATTTAPDNPDPTPSSAAPQTTTAPRSVSDGAHALTEHILIDTLAPRGALLTALLHTL